MDNELDAIERSEVRSVDDKQWYIECETLEIEKLKALQSIEFSKARIIEAQLEIERLKASKTGTNTLVISCRGCGSDFKYEGPDAEQMTECYDKFSYQHSTCT